ncbi:MAG: DNA alkylation repair protein, partial [Bacteroidetes bacterium]|nr:DNA alkylation repair protein [Bacteroidota bacterium]
MEPFKNIYNKRFYKEFSVELSSVYNEFNNKGFLAEIMNGHWESLELKQRMRHTTQILHAHMSGNYLQDLGALVKLSEQLIGKVQGNDALAYIFIPDYLEVYGLKHKVESVKAMETITQLSSCEFGIRPFFKKYPDYLVSTIIKWTNHENEHVRRLASEGSRPRLPWGMALTDFKKDPSPILPVLEALKNDTSEYVRRS